MCEIIYSHLSTPSLDQAGNLTPIGATRMLLNSSLRSSKVVRLAMLAIVSGFLALTPAVCAGQSSSIIIFDGPGAGTGYGQGTRASGMNSKGTIVGTVTTSGNKTYGFLRQSNG